jgi:hypothetical protein
MQLEVYNKKMPFLCPRGKNFKKKYQKNKRKLTFSQIEIVLELPFILYSPDVILYCVCVVKRLFTEKENFMFCSFLMKDTPTFAKRF